jgi:GMP synthase-like glutamine amidotransferase
MSRVLIISTCAEKLHELEFVRPIKKIIEGKCDFEIKHYSKVDLSFVKIFDKIIICGTSLKDNKFMENIDAFDWLKSFNGSVLGICAGMQILGMTFGDRLKSGPEIGFLFEEFSEEFLGIRDKQEVWHLHNNYVEFGENFDRFTNSKILQAVKYKEKEFYGVLFHPEVRQKEMILEFLKK